MAKNEYEIKVELPKPDGFRAELSDLHLAEIAQRLIREALEDKFTTGDARVRIVQTEGEEG